MARVLVTGASGLLGTWLLRTVPPGLSPVATAHRTPVQATEAVEVDLRRSGDTPRALRQASPEVVIHAAYQRQADAIVTATANLVEAASAIGAEVIALSTDAVFGGDGEPRYEESVPDPVWDYGRWKADAERAVISAGGSVVRCSLLVSLDPPDATTRRILSAGDPPTWYREERRMPAWAEEVAEALWRIALLASREREGIWHLPGPEVLSRPQLAGRIARLLGRPDPGEVVPSPPADSRPRDLRLSAERAHRQIGWDPSRIG